MSQQSLWHWANGEPEDQKRDGKVGNERRVEADDHPVTDGQLDAGDVHLREAGRLLDARMLHAELEGHVGPVDVTVTDNRRRMVSVSPSFPGGRPEVRLHHMFLDAGDEVVEAIADLVQGDGDRARPVLQEYISENRDAINFEVSESELEAKGECFDLREVFDDAKEYLLEAVGSVEQTPGEVRLDEIKITWGRRGRGAKSIRFGSFDFDQRLIRVHPALDRSWVPRFFVVYIVYHEMLHAVYPPAEEREAQDGERRRVHTAEFSRAEKEFPKYQEAQKWERENLGRFLERDDAS